VFKLDNCLAQDYESLLKSGKASDVDLIFGDKHLKAHKAILIARSPIFAAMFEHDTIENRTGKVKIEDIDQETFEELLHYIYSGKIHKLDRFAMELYNAADKVCLFFNENSLEL